MRLGLVPEGAGWKLAVTAAFCLATSAACHRLETRFNAHSRARVFDHVWWHLSTTYAFLTSEMAPDELGDKDWPALHDVLRAKAVSARTGDEFVLALVELLSNLHDPHVMIGPDARFWKLTGSSPPVPLFEKYAWIDQRLWVRFRSEGIVDERLREELQALELCEVMDVEGISARSTPIVLQLLSCPPGTRRTVNVRLAEDHITRVELQAPASWNWDPSILAMTVPQPLASAPDDGRVTSDRLASGIGYIGIRDFEDDEIVRRFDQALDELMDTQALVLDLQSNTGGLRSIVSAVLGRFIDAPRPYAQILRKSSIWQYDSWQASWDRVILVAEPRGKTYRRPVVVLINSGTGSGGEVAAMALRDWGRGPLVGEPTMGAGGPVSEEDVMAGLAFRYSRHILARLDGRMFQYAGIAPDVYVRPDENDLWARGRAALRDWRRQVRAEGLRLALILAQRSGEGTTISRWGSAGSTVGIPTP